MPSTRFSKSVDEALAADQAAMISTEEPGEDMASGDPLQESIVNDNMLSPEQLLLFAQSPEGKKLSDWAMRQYNTLRSARRSYERQWYTNLSFYMGKQYVEWSSREEKLIPLPKIDKYTPRITVNKIRPIVRTEMSKLTSQRPSASVMPSSNDDEDMFAARAGEQVWESLYDRLHFHKQLTTATYWLSITGNAYIKTFWDGSAYDSYSKTSGDIRWAAMSPFNILVPDLLEEDLQAQTFVLCVYSKPIEWIEIMYADVIPEGMNIAPSGDVDDIISPNKLGITGGDARPESALIIEAWIKPGATKLLPQGGFVTIVNNQIIQAGLNGIPYPHGEFPFAKLSHVPTGRFYAESVITDLIPLQIEYNRTQSQIIEAKNRSAKPQMLYDEGSVVPQKITTEPGLWIPIRPNAIRPQPIPLTELPSYVVQFNERQERNFEDISGQHEVSRGGAPGGVSAATAIAYLAERDDSYLATTIASLEMAVETVARQSLTLAAEYWDVPRLIKATGEDGGYEAILLKGSQIANGCDLRVESGSALPQSKSARMANVMDFMKMGYILPQEGFELLDMPMLQQWTTRRGIDKRSAQTENIDFKRLTLEQVQQADMMHQQNVMQGLVEINPETGMPPERGSVIAINDWDNDDVHIEIHELMQKSSSYKMMPEWIRREVENHVAQHKARRYARMIGMLPPVGPQPAGAYEPGNSGGLQAPVGSDGPGSVAPPGADPGMTDGTGPDQAQ
jgi:hypothetical protein